MKLFIDAIKDKPSVIDEWDDDFWLLLIKRAIVHHNKSITFEFTNTKTITIDAEI